MAACRPILKPTLLGEGFPCAKRSNALLVIIPSMRRPRRDGRIISASSAQFQADGKHGRYCTRKITVVRSLFNKWPVFGANNHFICIAGVVACVKPLFTSTIRGFNRGSMGLRFRGTMLGGAMPARFVLTPPNPVQLKPKTVEAFHAYIREAEAATEQTLHPGGPFLWSDRSSERTRQVRAGQVVAQFWAGRGPVPVPNGLIHDWIGAALIPNTTIEATMALIQDYGNHKNIYKPEVIDSRLISHHANDFQIYLRLLKKKIITVVLDTHHDVHYRPLDRTRWICRSYTTRIAEVENAGKPGERVLPPDTGHGFLWRLYSYWRFQERDGGVYVECRAISLTRDVPFGLGWAIEPIIQKLPKESLVNTLEATRQALHAKAK
jgi:hypothetical protein